jgi:glycosyltransferase involved in cell wall biosynthesis
MKIALLYGAFCLTFRGTLPFAGHRQDARGLTGSEYGFIRIAEELAALGHDVTAYTASAETEYNGIAIRPISAIGEIDSSFDAAVSINEPEALRDCKAKLKVCEQWLNSFDYCKLSFEKHVDLWLSPSQGHLDMVLGISHEVEIAPGKVGGYFKADAANWTVIPLGCDPERYPDTIAKIPGRVVYCSSPDRGLHWLLQEWPAIKRAVSHATLKIFYRLQPWIDGFADVAYTPPIEMLRSRAVYIQECLLRMSGSDWGITVCDSVSREQIEREMCEAEVLAYPTDTVRWSEGFSCTTLEACAARACPIITDCDALGGIYKGACTVIPRGNWVEFRQAIIYALTTRPYAAAFNETARGFAEQHTWRLHAERLVAAIEKTQGRAGHHAGSAPRQNASLKPTASASPIRGPEASESLEQWTAARNAR